MKRDIHLNANLGTRKGRDLAVSLGIFEVNQNMELLLKDLSSFGSILFAMK